MEVHHIYNLCCLVEYLPYLKSIWILSFCQIVIFLFFENINILSVLLMPICFRITPESYSEARTLEYFFTEPCSSYSTSHSYSFVCITSFPLLWKSLVTAIQVSSSNWWDIWMKFYKICKLLLSLLYDPTS